MKSEINSEQNSQQNSDINADTSSEILAEINTETIKLAKALIEKPSITPKDEGCQILIAKRLQALGFNIHTQRFGEVQNLIARYGTSKPLVAFAGHTDVVPVGNLSDWQTPPFTPTVVGEFLYGRGAADMKGGLAAMITATEQFLAKNPKFPGSLAFLITGDEEGPALFGTQKIMEYLSTENIHVDYCVVGEPSSVHQLGDMMKIGRRGSMTGHLVIKGIQGHVAYPHRADNPIHRMLGPLKELSNKIWDQGNDYFPPTSFQISNITGGTGAWNVIPGSMECFFNFRFNTEHSPESLQKNVHGVLETHALNYDLQWHVSGVPFLTQAGKLLQASEAAIRSELGIQPKTSTDGGTSDARFIAGPNTEVIELGPCNATIHAVNERVKIADLNALSRVYEKILENLLLIQ